MTAAIVAGVIAFIAIAAMIFVGIWTRNSNDGSIMPVPQRWYLLGYFLILGTALVYLLVVLAKADFPETPVTVASADADQFTASPGSPVLKHVFPETTPGSAPDVSLILHGENFKVGATVKVNSKEHAAKAVEAGTLINVPLQQSDLAGISSLTVEVINPADDTSTPPVGKRTSNALTVGVSKPVVFVKILDWPRPVTRELQLLLLVLFAGALGSYLHAIRSLTDFIGNRTVVASWFWWYIARPFIGMAMALIFYAVLRGGFLAGTPADAKVVNPFGVITIGALVGMFADKAAQKLADIFDTLFKADDTRKDKLSSPVVEKIEPDHVRPGTTPPPDIAVSGTHLSGVDKVRVNQQDRMPKAVDDKKVTVSLTAADIANAGEISLALMDKSGTVISAGTLFITDLDIAVQPTSPPTSPDTLPPANHGASYTANLIASGGTGPYTWKLVNTVKGLKIDSASGQLSGTPPKAGEFTVSVNVTDSTKASVSKPFKLSVR